MRLVDSRDFPDTIFDVLAVRRDAMENAERTLFGLVDSHFRALDHVRSNRQDALYRIADVEAISPEDARRAFGGVLLPDRRANRRYLGSGSRLMVAADEIERRLGGGDGMDKDWFTDAFLPRVGAHAG
ncbi:MAG: hypothetical protein ACOC02_07250 [Guyparkeria sp.]